MNKMLGDALRAALRPFGLSQSSLSQAKPAAAIAERTLRDELAEAEDRADQLRRQIVAGTCATAGHDWHSNGGANAGCSDDCRCSVPVHECRVCGDSDYGENAEAELVIAKCEARR